MLCKITDLSIEEVTKSMGYPKHERSTSFENLPLVSTLSKQKAGSTKCVYLSMVRVSKDIRGRHT